MGVYTSIALPISVVSLVRETSGSWFMEKVIKFSSFMNQLILMNLTHTKQNDNTFLFLPVGKTPFAPISVRCFFVLIDKNNIFKVLLVHLKEVGTKTRTTQTATLKSFNHWDYSFKSI